MTIPIVSSGTGEACDVQLHRGENKHWKSENGENKTKQKEAKWQKREGKKGTVRPGLVKLPLVPVRLFEQKYKKRENLENLKMKFGGVKRSFHQELRVDESIPILFWRFIPFIVFDWQNCRENLALRLYPWHLLAWIKVINENNLPLYSLNGLYVIVLQMVCSAAVQLEVLLRGYNVL